VLAGGDELLRAATRPRAAEALAGRVERSGWSWPTDFEPRESQRAAPRAAWLASLPATRGAAELARQAAAGTLEPLVPVLTNILRARIDAGRAGEVRAWFDAALREVDGDADASRALELLVLRLGLASDVSQARLAPGLIGDPEADPLHLAGLVAGNFGDRARERLLARLRDAIAREGIGAAVAGRGELVSALSAAVERLARAGRDADAAELRRAVQDAVRQGGSTPLTQALDARTWPTPPGLVPIDLAAEEPRSIPGLSGR
jgi:hypothetical protein